MSKKFECRVLRIHEEDKETFPEFGNVQMTTNGRQWYSWSIQEEDLVLLYDTIGQFLTHAGERDYEGKDDKVKIFNPEKDAPF